MTGPVPRPGVPRRRVRACRVVVLHRRDGSDAPFASIARCHNHCMIVVPHSPGPLRRPASESRRDRDELDELIDDLLPDSDERPGGFDVALLAAGLVLAGWAMLFDGPTFALVVGVIALALGCILPVRSAWRGAHRRRQARRHASTLGRGVPMDSVHPATVRLAGAYDELLALGEVESGTMAAAHSALIEAATLLHGRAPASEKELDYVEQRASAIEELVAALREADGTVDGAVEHAALIEAREELDAIGEFSSLARLVELIAEARAHRGDR